MSISQLGGSASTGTVRGRHAKLTYDPEDDGGSLTMEGSDWEETISNRNIIAVINNHRNGEKANSSVQKILLLSSVGSSTSRSSGSDYRFEEVHSTNLPQSFIDANSVSVRIPRFSHSNVQDTAPLLYVIISTDSGTGQAQSYFDNVVKPAFSATGIHEQGYYVHTTYSKESVRDFTHKVILPRANEGHIQTILLLSGDGGVVDTLNVLLSSSRSPGYVKPVVGLVTMGTGNALANSTGLKHDLTRGLRHFYRGQTYSLPTFAATFSGGSEFVVDEGRTREPLTVSSEKPGVIYGAVVCSWALHASLVADSDTAEYRKHGTERFQMAAKELLVPSDGAAPHVYKGKVTLTTMNERRQEVHKTLDSKEYMYLLATMVSNLEQELTISPASKPLDGQLRLLHFGPTSVANVMKILSLAFQGGKHVEDEAVGYEDIEALRINFEEPDGRWRRVCVDGKIIRVGKDGWVEVKKNTADVLDIVADLRS